MKKLALLMGSLLVVGATASAKEIVVAPEVKEVIVIKEVVKKNTGLRATSVAQTLGYEDWNHVDGHKVYLSSNASFAYGPNSEWTGSLEGRKYWNADLKNDSWSGHGDTRIQLAAKRNFKFSEGSFSVGPRWRGYRDADRLYLDTNYSYAPKFLADYGISLTGYFNPEYRSYENQYKDDTDRYGIEMMPLTVGFRQFRIGYYFNGYKGVNSSSDYNYVDQQIRAYLPIWKNDKWAFNLENRLYINKHGHGHTGSTSYGIDTRTHKNFSANRTYVKASYKATDKLTLNAAIAYGYGKYDKYNSKTKSFEDKATGIYKEATLGFSYKI